MQGVEWRDGEVAALVGHRVAKAEDTVVPRPFDAVHLVGGRVLAGRVHDLVKDKELCLGAKVGRVGDTGALHVLDRLAGHVARVARIGLAADGVIDVADQAERRRGADGIDDGRVRIADQDHVARLDALESANRRAIEAQPFLKGVFGAEVLDRQREVLPLAEQVGKLDVDDFDSALFDQF